LAPAKASSLSSRGALPQTPWQKFRLNSLSALSALGSVLTVCRQARTLSEAGRTLFHTLRQRKKTVNDADRLRTYLARFALTWEQLQQHDVGA